MPTRIDMHDVLAVILAGGKGTRLEPLTRDRAKPAVPFGGLYRIIDFTLSNCLNSGIRKMLVLTQYKAMSLDRHISVGWQSYLSREMGEFIDVVPPQQRIDEHWYQGTADAVYQNIYSIEKVRPTHIVVLAGDHIYKMDYMKLVERHVETRADVTVGALRADLQAATQFGVMEVDGENRIVGFEEKPPQPKPIPGDPEHALSSMGIYVFNARFLFEQLCLDATRPDSKHDFGRDIIPSVIRTHKVFAYPFLDENRKKDAYWRNVGTLEAYYEANMDLISVDPLLNLYDRHWPIRTYQPNLPPPKFVFAERGNAARRGAGAGQHRLPGHDHFRRPGRAERAGPERPHQQLFAGRGLGALRGRECRPARQGPPRDHRQGGGNPARHRDRLRPRTGPQPRLHRQRNGPDRDCQDARRRAFRRTNVRSAVKSGPEQAQRGSVEVFPLFAVLPELRAVPAYVCQRPLDRPIEYPL